MAELTADQTTQTQGQSAGVSSPTSENTNANVENPITETKANVNEGTPANDKANDGGDDVDGMADSHADTQAGNDAGLAGTVSADVTKQLHELETRLDATLGESEQRLTSAIETGSEIDGLERLTTEQVVQYVPNDAPQYVASYLTPALWGIAAGIVAWLIGYVWDAMRRLLGLAGRK